MSKIGRASRNASLQRVETITADKTITLAESGETFFIGALTGTVAVTLPAVKAGAYFRFVWNADMDNNSGVLTIASASGAGTMTGLIMAAEVDGTGPSYVVDNGDDTTITVDGNPDCHAGTTIEVLCDGTNWIATGTAVTDAGGTATGVVAFS